MSNYPTDKLTSVFAVNGDKRLPPATAVLAGSGRASQYEGFKLENSKPLSQGGIPPFREDFNGIFNLFSQFLVWYQQGGVMQYDNGLDYEVNNEVYYNNVKYRCIQANGVSTTVALPTDPLYWEVIHNFGDAVRYNTAQSLSSAQQSTARTNIGAVSDTDFNTLVGASLTKDSDYLNLLNRNGGYLTRFPWIDIPNVFSRNAPVMCTLLWSGDLNHGDITLLNAFTDYDVLMCVYGTNDNSPGTAPWNFSMVPVWMLKKAIIDKNVFGFVPATFDILNDHERRWEIDVADSTSTFFKYHDNQYVQMWRVIGIRYTQAAAPTIVQA